MNESRPWQPSITGETLEGIFADLGGAGAESSVFPT